MTDALHFVFLELGRLKAKFNESQKCKTLLERFSYSWKYMHLLDSIPPGFQDPLVLDLFKASEYALLPIEKQQQYDKAMTTQLDIIAQNRWENQQAFKDGQKAGIEKGLEKASRDHARKMLDLGMKAETIAAVTGLSETEIARLSSD